jgi:hypothetical protein
MPVAEKISVARVASPLSMDQTYQALYLHALKAYLSQGKRLVREGDLVGFGIDTDALRCPHDTPLPARESLDGIVPAFHGRM